MAHFLSSRSPTQKKKKENGREQQKAYKQEQRYDLGATTVNNELSVL